jgi:membrane protein
MPAFWLTMFVAANRRISGISVLTLAKPSTIAILNAQARLCGTNVLRLLIAPLRIAAGAFRNFLADDGWAIASHIALSTLMAMFPFLIVVTALAGPIFGSKQLADEAARILLETWPQQVAAPIALDITGVLTNTRGDVLTFGVLFALYFASSGVESLRIGLNRAYDIAEPRSWWLLRLESIVYVLVAAVAILAFSFLVVLAPLIWTKLVQFAPTLEPFGNYFTFARYAAAALVLTIALIILHLFLPAGWRSFREIAPGVVATLLLWLASGAAFGRYLAEYAFAYVSMYAGLASAMIALVFLYVCAAIFIYGAELNSVIAKARGSES